MFPPPAHVRDGITCQWLESEPFLSKGRIDVQYEGAGGPAMAGVWGRRASG